MSDVTFTPKERGLLADRVLWTPGARTEQISLADEAQYDLHGQRQDGAGLAVSKSNMPFVGRYRCELSDSGIGVANRLYTEFEVLMPRTVDATAFAVVSNVLTVTVAAGHEVAVGQWIVVTGFASLATGQGTALQVTSITATTIVMSLTTADDSATEAGAVKYQPIAQTAAQWTTVFDNVVADEVSIAIGTAHAGMYRVSLLNDAVDSKQAMFHSDGVEMIIQSFFDDLTEDVMAEPVGFDDADATAASTNLSITAGVVSIANRNAIATRIVVEFKPAIWTSHDTNGFACFFEKDGQIILKNRLGATHEFAIENVGTSRANRVASPDPNARITELQGPIT